MSADLAIWLVLWLVFVAALRAVKETWTAPRLFKCGPNNLAMSALSLLADRGMDLLHMRLTLTQFPLRPYIIVWLLLSAAATVVTLSALRHRQPDEHEQGGIGA